MATTVFRSNYPKVESIKRRFFNSVAMERIGTGKFGRISEILLYIAFYHSTFTTFCNIVIDCGHWEWDKRFFLDTKTMMPSKPNTATQASLCLIRGSMTLARLFVTKCGV